MSKPTVPAKQFITTWENAVKNANADKTNKNKPHTVQTVATALGIKDTSVGPRVKKFRAEGVPLSKMPRAQVEGRDYSELADFARSLQG